MDLANLYLAGQRSQTPVEFHQGTTSPARRATLHCAPRQGYVLKFRRVFWPHFECGLDSSDECGAEGHPGKKSRVKWNRLQAISQRKNQPMKPTLGQVRQAIDLAQSAVGNLNVKLRNNDLPAWQKPQIEKDLRLQTNAVIYWSAEFRRLGGGPEVIMPIDNLFAKSQHPEEVKAGNAAKAQAQQTATATAADASAFREKITRLRNAETLIIMRCQALLEVSEQRGNAIGAGFAHAFGGGSMATPYDIMRWATVTSEIGAAEHRWAEGKPDRAEFKLQEAAFKLIQAARQLDRYESDIAIGAERSEAALKVTAALAVIVASGGTALGVGGAMAVAATGEAALQGTLLIATGVEGKSTISGADLSSAALEVIIAGGSAGLGQYAKGVAANLAPGIAVKILRRTPTDKEIEFVAGRIANYISANAGFWAKRTTGLDKEKDINWWLTAVTPAFGDIAVELSKEQSLNRAIGG